MKLERNAAAAVERDAMDTPTPAPTAVLPLAYRSPDASLRVPPVPVELSYSRVDAAAAAELAPLLKRLLVVAVLCGPAVATCFAVIAHWRMAAVLHLAVYAALLWSAVLAGVKQNRLAGSLFPALHSPARAVLDTIAGVGLAIIGAGPLLWQLLNPARYNVWGSGGPVLTMAAAFTLLAATTYRHLLQYRALATVLKGVGRPRLARSLRVLGWTKFVVETLWLTCCAFPLAFIAFQQVARYQGRNSDDGVIIFAFGALFGIPVFAVVWVMMIITHATAATAVRGFSEMPLAGRQGYEVPVD